MGRNETKFYFYRKSQEGTMGRGAATVSHSAQRGRVIAIARGKHLQGRTTKRSERERFARIQKVLQEVDGRSLT